MFLKILGWVLLISFSNMFFETRANSVAVHGYRAPLDTEVLVDFDFLH